MVKQLQVFLDNDVYEKLKEKKTGKSWVKFLTDLVK